MERIAERSWKRAAVISRLFGGFRRPRHRARLSSEGAQARADRRSSGDSGAARRARWRGTIFAIARSDAAHSVFRGRPGESRRSAGRERADRIKQSEIADERSRAERTVTGSVTRRVDVVISRPVVASVVCCAVSARRPLSVARARAPSHSAIRITRPPPEAPNAVTFGPGRTSVRGIARSRRRASHRGDTIEFTPGRPSPRDTSRGRRNLRTSRSAPRVQCVVNVGTRAPVPRLRAASDMFSNLPWQRLTIGGESGFGVTE